MKLLIRAKSLGVKDDAWDALPLSSTKSFASKDQRAPWLYIVGFAVFLACCKTLHIDPQEPLPASVLVVASLLALLKM